MKWIELNNTGFGECIVLGGKREILMVDCGSMNTKLPGTDISQNANYDKIAQRYDIFTDRYFLLTHYHKDHLSGFKHIIKTHPDYFSRVFLPFMPVGNSNNADILDFAVFAHVFMSFQTDCSNINTSCIKAFELIYGNVSAARLFTLKSGDTFSFDKSEYEVLWPPEKGFEFTPELTDAVEQLNIIYASPFAYDFEREFFHLKNDFIKTYLKCCQANSVNDRTLPHERHRLSERLIDLLDKINLLKSQLNESKRAHDVRDILTDPVVSQAFSDSVNMSSLVFHNIRTSSPGIQDVLMTGDCMPEVISKIQDKLYDGYYVLKAPHHGTSSGYSPIFNDMAFSHILISNGEYHSGGSICEEYIKMEEAVKHCSGNSACKWFNVSQCSCNRLIYCYDFDNSGTLTLKCKAAAGKSKAPDCMIRTVNYGSESGCFCDVK